MSMKLINLEQRSAVNQNIMSVIFTCQINSEDKSFVFMFYVISQRELFRPCRPLAGRKPIGNVKVNVHTVNIGILIRS